MPSTATPSAAATTATATATEADRVYQLAAELFGVMSTPLRLKIISALCRDGERVEKNVSQLLAEIDTTQPNMSQHLATLVRAGVLARRRDGAQVFYRVQSEKVVTLCRAVCTQVAIEMDDPGAMAPADRLVSATALGL